MGEGASSFSAQPGEILAGKYRVERVLGEGGMGVVVEAEHIHLEEKVAIKFMRPEAIQNADLVMRFIREAKAAVKLKGPHIARVQDVGTFEGGAPYIVMEYLEGDDLCALIKKSGRLSLEQSAEIVIQTCDALAEAHGRGMVHRDIKPPNLFMAKAPDGTLQVKVLDFGIAKATIGKSAQWAATQTQAVLGSPLYMSPEQMRSTKDVDVRADIWAMGVVLYESLTGALPFEAETMPQLCALILEGAPSSLAERRGDLPPAIQGILDRCLAKDRNQRFANVAELANAIAPYAPRRAQALLERINTLVYREVITEVTGSHQAPVVQSQTAPTVDIVQPSGGDQSGPIPALSPGAATAASWAGGTGAFGQRRKSPALLIGALAGGAFLLLLTIVIGLVVFKKKTPVEAATTPPAIASETTAAAPAPPTEPTPPPIATEEPAPPPSAEPSSTVAKTAQPPAKTTKATAAPPRDKAAPTKPPPRRDDSSLTHR